MMSLKKVYIMLRWKRIEDEILDITNLGTNASLNAKTNEFKGEIPSISNLTTNASLSIKINKVKDEVPNVTNLATTTAFTAVETKIPNVYNLVKKTDYNKKICENENKIPTDHNREKYITVQEFNKLTSENFTARLKQANLASANDTAHFVKKTDFDNKLKNVT